VGECRPDRFLTGDHPTLSSRISEVCGTLWVGAATGVLSCWNRYLAMVFAQLTYGESLRDIETRLRLIGGKLYHMGFPNKFPRSTLADANTAHN